jgi:GDP-L-fucose synthase
MPTNIYGPNDNFDLQSSHALPALIRKFHLAKLASQMDWDAIERDERCFGPIPEDLRVSLGLDFRDPKTETRNLPSVILWGTGTPRREFLHVDDLAEACVFLMTLSEPVFQDLCRGERSSETTEGARAGTCTSLPLINIGCGEDYTVKSMADTVARIVGFDGDVTFDRSKPDGTPRKLLDVTKLTSFGWSPKIALEEGIKRTYEWYLKVSNS